MSVLICLIHKIKITEPLSIVLSNNDTKFESMTTPSNLKRPVILPILFTIKKWLKLEAMFLKMAGYKLQLSWHE